jgi:hypothetical protein
VSLDQLFFYSALVGGTLFLIQLVLLFTGGGGGVDVDTDLGGGDAGHPGADVSFKVLSLQGITTFVMMFGLVGMAMRIDEQASATVSTGVAFAAGAGSTWVIGRIFYYFTRLQSTGNVDMKSAVGAIGEVYLTVGPGKIGKVTITVGNRSLTMDAVAEKGETLATGTPIRVVRVVSDTTVSVEKN